MLSESHQKHFQVTSIVTEKSRVMSACNKALTCDSSAVYSSYD